MTLSRPKALLLRETIHAMNETQQKEVYRIIREHKIPHTVKSDGVFFENNVLTKAAVADIERYIKFCRDVSATAEA